MTGLLLKGSLPRRSRRDAMFIEKSIPLRRSPFMGDRESVALLKELLHFQMVCWFYKHCTATRFFATDSERNLS